MNILLAAANKTLFSMSLKDKICFENFCEKMQSHSTTCQSFHSSQLVWLTFLWKKLTMTLFFLWFLWFNKLNKNKFKQCIGSFMKYHFLRRYNFFQISNILLHFFTMEMWFLKFLILFKFEIFVASLSKLITLENSF